MHTRPSGEFFQTPTMNAMTFDEGCVVIQDIHVTGALHGG